MVGVVKQIAIPLNLGVHAGVALGVDCDAIDGHRDFDVASFVFLVDQPGHVGNMLIQPIGHHLLPFGSLDILGLEFELAFGKEQRVRRSGGLCQSRLSRFTLLEERQRTFSGSSHILCAVIAVRRFQPVRRTDLWIGTIKS